MIVGKNRRGEGAGIMMIMTTTTTMMMMVRMAVQAAATTSIGLLSMRLPVARQLPPRRAAGSQELKMRCVLRDVMERQQLAVRRSGTKAFLFCSS